MFVTKSLLKKWGACAAGVAEFNKRFPNGAEFSVVYATAKRIDKNPSSVGLFAADWAQWLLESALMHGLKKLPWYTRDALFYILLNRPKVARLFIAELG